MGIDRQTLAMWVLAAVMAAGGAIAASQGTLGTTSTATTVVTLVIPETLRLSGLSDFSFGTYSGSGGLTANTDVCVYDNASNGSYHVLITDSSALSPTGFSVQNVSGTQDIPYSVWWNSSTGTTGNYGITFNKTHTATGANTQSTDCSIGGKSNNLQIVFAAANLVAAKAGGTYSTILTVEVEP